MNILGMRPVALLGSLVAVAAALAFLFGSGPSAPHGVQAAGTFDATGIYCIDIDNTTIFPAIPREVENLVRFQPSKKDASLWDVTQVSVVGDTNGDGIPDAPPSTAPCSTKLDTATLTPGVQTFGQDPLGRPSAVARKQGSTFTWEVCSEQADFGATGAWIYTKFTFTVAPAGKDLNGLTGTNEAWINTGGCRHDSLAPPGTIYYASNATAVKRIATKGPATVANDGDDWDGDGCSDWNELNPDPVARRGVDPFDATDCSASASNLTAVYDIMVHDGTKATDVFHCISLLSHNPANNKLFSAAQCYDNQDLMRIVGAEPINYPAGEGPDGNIGPPPPPPYTENSPGTGEGSYAGDNATLKMCFGDVGGTQGPNIIWVVTLTGMKTQRASDGKVAGTVDVFGKQSNKNCRDQTPVGTPFLDDKPINLYPILDAAPCPSGNCVQAPWRTANDEDYDNDGCKDWQELITGPNAACGDDPWNPNDPTGSSSTLDVSGSYNIIARAARANACAGGLLDGVVNAACTGQPDGHLVAGFYYPCVADVQQNVNALTAKVFCYIDSPNILVNPQAGGTCVANPNRCGDGLRGAPVPGTTVGTYPTNPRNFADVDDKQTVLTGTLNKKTNNIELSGCFEDRDGTGALGDVYIRAEINAHSGHGSVLLWAAQANNLGTQTHCIGSPTGDGAAIPIDLVKQAPGSKTTALVSLTCDAIPVPGTVHATTALPHQMVNGVKFTNNVVIAGAAPAGFNGKFAVNVTGPTTFTYIKNPCPAAAAAPAGTYGPQRDSDGDGCSDKKELGDVAATGGLRDPANHYDYFNPTNDHLNRVDDILAVVNEYFINDPPGLPDMNSKTDRTAVTGANAWNLGPPDGLQTVADILAAVKSYFHDC